RRSLGPHRGPRLLRFPYGRRSWAPTHSQRYEVLGFYAFPTVGGPKLLRIPYGRR
ncbi:hypothetical protein T484DRAFT_1560375, partial [Baffinella frigidus]